MRVLLDTHIWVKWLTPNAALSARELDGLDKAAAKRELHVAAISLWEVQVLHAKRRVELPLPFAEWLLRATDARAVTIVPLDIEVVTALDALPAKFHGDPADRLIVATARAHAMLLATHDRLIRRARVAKIWAP